MNKKYVENTHYGLVMPYGGKDQGQHWFRWWLIAWWHQAITWTNIDWTSLRSSDVYLRAISLDTSQPSVTKISLQLIFLRFYWNLPGDNELNIPVKISLSSCQCCWLLCDPCTHEWLYCWGWLWSTDLGWEMTHSVADWNTQHLNKCIDGIVSHIFFQILYIYIFSVAGYYPLPSFKIVYVHMQKFVVIRWMTFKLQYM